MQVVGAVEYRRPAAPPRSRRGRAAARAERGCRGAGPRARPRRADGCWAILVSRYAPRTTGPLGRRSRWVSSRSVSASAQWRSSSSSTLPSMRAPIASNSRQALVPGVGEQARERVRAERLRERLVGRYLLREQRPVAHGPAALMEDRLGLGEQPRLADPRVPGQEYGARRVGECPQLRVVARQASTGGSRGSGRGPSGGAAPARIPPAGAAFGDGGTESLCSSRSRCTNADSVVARSPAAASSVISCRATLGEWVRRYRLACPAQPVRPLAELREQRGDALAVLVARGHRPVACSTHSAARRRPAAHPAPGGPGRPTRQ